MGNQKTFAGNAGNEKGIMAILESLNIGIPGVEIWLEYNANNNRLLRVEWTIPEPGIAVRARVWNDGVLVVDRTEGQGSGTVTIPGNIRLVETTDEYGTFWDLPPNITYQFNMQLFAP